MITTLSDGRHVLTFEQIKEIAETQPLYLEPEDRFVRRMCARPERYLRRDPERQVAERFVEANR